MGDPIQILARALSSILFVVTLGLVYAAIRKQAAKAYHNMDPHDFTVRMPKMYTWIFVLFALICGACSLFFSIFPIEDAGSWVYVLLAALSLFGAGLAVGSLLLQIKVTGNEIRYSGLFMRTKTFTFGDIERVKVKQSGEEHRVTLYSENKKLLSIYTYYIGYDMFIGRLQEQVEQGGEEAPEDWKE